MAGDRTPWIEWSDYNREAIEDLESQLSIGDTVEFICGMEHGHDSHTGIYVGRYQDKQHAVIHFGIFQGNSAFSKTKTIPNAFATGRRPKVRVDDIDEIPRPSSKVRINNSRESEVPLDPDFIVKVAKIMHRCEATLVDNLRNSNREHFVDLCRYDIDWTGQVFVAYSSGITGEWYTSGNITDVEDILCPGDRLEFPRLLFYAHWGIYVGRYEGMRHGVINFRMLQGGWKFFIMKILGWASSASQKPEIRADTIEMILDGSKKVRINNSRDNDVHPLNLNPYEIIGRAKNVHTQQTLDYSVPYSNCEHFVNLCRYDDAQSEQVAEFGFVLRLIVMGIGAFIIAFVLTSVDDAVDSIICPYVLRLSSFCREYY